MCESVKICKNNTECGQFMHCFHGKCIHRIICPCEAPYSCDHESGLCVNTCPQAGCPYPYECINGICGFPSCTSKWQCKDGQICPNGYCQSICLYDSDCRSGYKCQGQKCIRICTQAGGCPEGHYCNSEGQCVEPQCQSSFDCNNDEYCRYGVCTKKPCQKDGDCKPGFMCPVDLKVCIKKTDECARCEEKNMECVKRRFGSRTFVSCEIGISCAKISHCPENTHCGINNICVPNDCNKKNPCIRGYVCFNGQCVPEHPIKIVNPPGCNQVTFTCGPGKVCKNGHCIHLDCYDDMACLYPKRCLFGVCRLPCDPDSCPGKCINQICNICKENEDCSQIQPPQIVCTKDYHCPSPLVCRNGQCIQFICKTKGECPPLQDCVAGFCMRIKVLNQTECHSNKDCGQQEACVKGVCKPPCTTASECAEGVPCINKKCVVDRCKFDFDCGPDKHCSDGECIVVKRCMSSGSKQFQCIHGLLIKEKKCQGMDCDDGYECWQGRICLPKNIKCRGDSHCSEMSKCGSYGKCVNRECTVDSDCYSVRTRECLLGLCVPRLPCITHTDCAAPQKCIGRICQVEPPPPTCTDDSECPPEAGLCKGGNCVKPLCKSKKDCCKNVPKYPCYLDCRNGVCESVTSVCNPWLCPSKKCNKYNTTCMVEPPYNNNNINKTTIEIVCPLGYRMEDGDCIPPDCYDRCPQPEEICLYGKCMKPPGPKPPCYCSNGEPCTNGGCRPIPLPPPCYIDQNCRAPFHCDPMTLQCTGSCKNDNDCQQVSDDTVKYVCKDNICQCEITSCETDCPQPGYMCRNKRCKEVECKDIWECGPGRTCFLGLCITHTKVSLCAADERMEANRTLHCIPKEIYTSTTTDMIVITEPLITCKDSSHCPKDMSCKKNRCTAKVCIDSVDVAPESTVDKCDPHKMCFSVTVAGKKRDMCLPVFPCEMGRCSAPLKPNKGTYICHKNHMKCYVSTDECQTDFDCNIKANGKGESICILDSKKKQKVCIRIDCKAEQACPKLRPSCFNSRCQTCIKCKNNQDCPAYQQCLIANKEGTGCCVKTLTCPPSDCNKVLGKEKGDYCLAGVCTLCYKDEGIVMLSCRHIYRERSLDLRIFSG